MDSLSQVALGAAVSVAVMGRRTAVWKAALWGAAAGTLPDLDVLLDYGDPVSNMTFHRAESHAFFYLTLLSPLLAWKAYLIHGRAQNLRRWWLAIWLSLITHPVLDTFTVYGTQLLAPFTNYPFGIGSIFIIDPLYTLPLLIGVLIALLRREYRGLRWNTVGLCLSSAYLIWSVAVQAHVRDVVMESTIAHGKTAAQVLVTPTAFNTVLWRVVVMSDSGYYEGFYSLFDRSRGIYFDRFDSATSLLPALKDNWPVQRLAWFTHGFYTLTETDGKVVMSDLRMGQEPHYTFTFALAQRGVDGSLRPIKPQSLGSRGEVRPLLAWLWRRMWGAQIRPPR